MRVRVTTRISREACASSALLILMKQHCRLYIWFWFHYYRNRLHEHNTRSYHTGILFVTWYRLEISKATEKDRCTLIWTVNNDTSLRRSAVGCRPYTSQQQCRQHFTTTVSTTLHNNSIDNTAQQQCRQHFTTTVGRMLCYAPGM